MPSCYLIALCAGSSLDRDTNSFSLFSLIDELAAPEGGVYPLEFHTYWELEPEELNQAFEFKVYVEDAGGRELHPTVPFRLMSSARRWRQRSLGIRVPNETGEFHLRVQWKRAGEESWTTVPVRWPLVLTIGSPPQPSEQASATVE